MKQAIDNKEKIISTPKEEPINEKPLFFDYVVNRLDREDKKSDSILDKLLDSYKQNAQLEQANHSLTAICNDFKGENALLSKEKIKYNEELQDLKDKIKAVNIHFIIRNNCESNLFNPTGMKPFNVVDFYFGNADSRIPFMTYYDETKATQTFLNENNKYGKALCALLGISLPIDDKEWEGRQIQ